MLAVPLMKGCVCGADRGDWGVFSSRAVMSRRVVRWSASGESGFEIL